MFKADGLGLAANQVGSTRAIAYIDISDTDEGKDTKPIAIINPTIELFSEETCLMNEGCLSLPNFRDDVMRPKEIRLRYFDTNFEERILEIGGLLARVIQHEVDHLNGIYFFERLSPVRRAIAHPKLKRIQLGLVTTEYQIEPYKPTKR